MTGNYKRHPLQCLVKCFFFCQSSFLYFVRGLAAKAFYIKRKLVSSTCSNMIRRAVYISLHQFTSLLGDYIVDSLHWEIEERLWMADGKGFGIRHYSARYSLNKTVQTVFEENVFCIHWLMQAYWSHLRQSAWYFLCKTIMSDEAPVSHFGSVWPMWT